MRLFPFVALAFVVSCSSHQPRSREVASDPTPPLIYGEVWGPEDERITQSIIGATMDIADRNRQNGKFRRDAHPKHHACVKAYWSSAKTSLEADSQQGVFVANETSRPAWIRFSNGDPKGNSNPDSEKDIRGFAIKIMNEPNTPRGSQDLIGITAPVFFTRDPEDYLNLFKALREGLWGIAKYGASGLGNASNIQKVMGARIKPENPLLIKYHTSVPARIGDGIQRLTFSPCPSTVATATKFKDVRDANNGMRVSLTETLSRSSACFRVDMHINSNPSASEVENPTLEWDTTTTDYKFVGEIFIPQQKLSHSREEEAFCENISMDPWNTIEEIRPVGRISRIRKAVYSAVSERRLKEKGLARGEPVDHEPCAHSHTKSLCQAD